MTDLYETLGVERTASSADIKAAYRRAAKTAHPDTPNGSAAKFQAISEAHDTLGNDESRRAYDYALKLEDWSEIERRPRRFDTVQGGTFFTNGTVGR